MAGRGTRYRRSSTRFRRQTSRSYSGAWCNPSDYVLVVAEKPKAARKIVEALSDRAARCKLPRGAVYWVLRFDGETYVVASAVGHLFGLYTRKRGFPVFEYEWRPLWEIDSSASYTKPYYATLEVLSRKAKLYINACDYDIEGSVIGYLVIKWFGDTSRARRVRFSSLTPPELRRAFRRQGPLDIEMVEAGLARHELDWLWGINISRALMEAVRLATGRRVTLSAGRVQSPTLAEAARRDIERGTFVPLPYFRVAVKLLYDGHEITVESLSFTEKRKALRWVQEARREGYARVVEVVGKTLHVPPPYPFNLPDLQSEAARHFGYSPLYTQKIAEDLYLDGLISYPRTNSQRIPPSLDIDSILQGLRKDWVYSNLIEALLDMTKGKPRPRNGPKDDPAHPAIHPTGVLPKEPLSGPRAKIYDLIVKRFLASMAIEAVMVVQTVTFSLANTSLRASGKSIIQKGWLSIYEPYASLKETALPPLRKGEVVKIKSIRLGTLYTRPPPAYSKIKLVKWMETNGIGTEATRARIVELLFSRGYLVQSRSGIIVSDLGYAVIDILEKYFSDIVSVELTRKFEQSLQDIRYGKRRRVDVVNEAKKILAERLNTFKKHYMNEAGLLLAEALSLRTPPSRCAVCGRRAEDGKLCHLHMSALKNIVEAYSEWYARLGPISVSEYIRKLSAMKGVGRFAKDILTKAPEFIVDKLSSHEPG